VAYYREIQISFTSIEMLQISKCLALIMLQAKPEIWKWLPLISKCNKKGGRQYISEPGSSVSVVSGYGLDDQAIEVRSPAEMKGFFL
jgi:hypothetical protein